MIALRGIIQNGQLVLPQPAELPDGTEVLVEMTPLVAEKIGIDESEWHDDPAALADWDAWLKTIEPLEFTPEELAQFARFDEEMRRFNVDVVRQQMESELEP
jgi:hypothetical protein